MPANEVENMIKTLSINPFEDLSSASSTIELRACVGVRNKKKLWNVIWSLEMHKEVMRRIEL